VRQHGRLVANDVEGEHLACGRKASLVLD
jgi:hypothetical protein